MSKDKSKQKKNKDPMITLLDLVIVVLIFVMLYSAQSALFYKSRVNKKSFSQDASRLAFDLQRNDYASFIQGNYINEFNGETVSEGYHALAEYIEAASVYKVYDAKGYTDRAAEQKTIMSESRKVMGELTVFADKADEMFGIKE